MPETKHPPFRRELIETPFPSRFKTLKDNPEKILRFNPLSESIEQATERYNRSRRLFHELQDQYGIAVPKIETVIGNDPEGKPSVIIVTDRIHGESLDRMSFKDLDPATVNTKFDTFFNNMVQYDFDKFKQGGFYIWDVKHAQLVYGRRKGEAEDNIYYVDLDPVFRNHDPQNPKPNFFYTLEGLAVMMEVIESKLDQAGNPHEFTKARQKMLSFLKGIPQNIRPIKPYDVVKSLITYLSAGREERIKRQTIPEDQDSTSWKTVETW